MTYRIDELFLIMKMVTFRNDTFSEWKVYKLTKEKLIF